MRVTYYGHSCFAVEAGGSRLLFDPFITPNELAGDIDPAAIEADFILISHAHEDHIADAVAIARRTEAMVVSNFEIVQWLARQGVGKVHGLNHGGGCELAFGRVKYVQAVHSSSFPDGSYGGNPGGFVIESSDGAFYYSGDTALTRDMELIRGTTLDFAVLCVGDTYTMGIADAARACDLIGCDRVMGVHYDTFPPIRIDHAAAVKTFSDAGKELRLVPIGGSTEF